MTAPRIPRFPRLALLWLGAAALFLAAAIRPAGSTEDVLVSRGMGPQGVVLNARPTLLWYVWALSGSPLVDARMVVNGVPVRVGYAPVNRAVYFTPGQPLSPGPYSVECQVLFANGATIGKEWDFELSEQAVPDVPAPSDIQYQALRAVNGFRRQVRLPECRLDTRLCAAAVAHSAYLFRNMAAAHEETPNRPGFTGADPALRMETMGYVAPRHLEDVAVHVGHPSPSPQDLVRELFDAPYHRLPFLRPDAVDLGAGYSEPGYLTLDWGTMRAPRFQAPALTLYPLPGQRDVPLTFEGHERPDPLRIHGVQAPVGYILSYVVSGDDDVGIRFLNARLNTSSGEPVPILVNTPANDDQLHDALLIIPREPLRPHTRYIANVHATTAAGANLSRTWDFTTGADPAEKVEGGPEN